MRQWYLLSIGWADGETLTTWRYCTYKEIYKTLGDYTRLKDVSMVNHVSIRVCESEEEAKTYGSV